MTLAWAAPAPWTALMLTITINGPQDMQLYDRKGHALEEGNTLTVVPGANPFIAREKTTGKTRSLVYWYMNSQSQKVQVTFPTQPQTKLPTLPALPAPKPPHQSLCQSRRLRDTCSRQTYWDDLAFSGYWYQQSLPTGTLAPSLFWLADDLNTSRRFRAVSDAEFALAKTPQKTTMERAVRENLLLLQCDRVSALWHEAASYQLLTPRIWLAPALCSEFALKPAQAITWLDQALHQHNDPILAYHQARLLMSRDPGRAEQILKSCRRRYPGYYPCYQLSGQVKRWHGGIYQAASAAFRQANSAAIHQLAAAVTASKNSNAQKREAVAHWRQQAPQNFEGWVYEALLQGRLNDEQRLYLDKFSIASLSLSSQLLAGIRPYLSQSDYELVLGQAIEAAPDHPQMWWHFIEYAARRHNCEQVLLYSQRALGYLKKLPPNFIGVRDQCRGQWAGHGKSAKG